MDFRELVLKALKNIIQKQIKINQNSRFIFLKIQKEISSAQNLNSIDDLKNVKFVKEKTFAIIQEEINKIGSSNMNKIGSSNMNKIVGSNMNKIGSSNMNKIVGSNMNKIVGSNMSKIGSSNINKIDSSNINIREGINSRNFNEVAVCTSHVCAEETNSDRTQNVNYLNIKSHMKQNKKKGNRWAADPLTGHSTSTVTSIDRTKMSLQNNSNIHETSQHNSLFINTTPEFELLKQDSANNYQENIEPPHNPILNRPNSSVNFDKNKEQSNIFASEKLTPHEGNLFEAENLLVNSENNFFNLSSDEIFIEKMATKYSQNKCCLESDQNVKSLHASCKRSEIHIDFTDVGAINDEEIYKGLCDIEKESFKSGESRLILPKLSAEDCSDSKSCILINTSSIENSKQYMPSFNPASSSLTNGSLGSKNISPIKKEYKAALNNKDSEIIVLNSSVSELEESIFNSFSDLTLDATLDKSGLDMTSFTSSVVYTGAKKRKYIPGYRTASYAILKALYQFNGSHKHLVVLRATPYTDTVFDKTQRFSAFSAFKMLQKKGLIYCDTDSKYFLTDAGYALCTEMFANDSFTKPIDNEIKIIIDSREKKSSRDRNFFQAYFHSKNIPNETRFLSLGDFIWIRDEKLLGCIVERKQTSDLVVSISDGRYKEQKNRMLKIKEVLGVSFFYLIENLKVNESRKHYTERCLLEIRLQGFVVIETESINESSWFLEQLDRMIRDNTINNMKNKHVQQKKEIIESENSKNSKNSMSYGSFIEEGNKNKISVKDALLIALLSIRGLSKELAIGLTEKYKSLKNFRKCLKNQILKREIMNFKIQEKEMSEKIFKRIENLLR